MSQYSYGLEKIRASSEIITDSKGSARDALWDAYNSQLHRFMPYDETVPLEFHKQLNESLRLLRAPRKPYDVVVDLTVEIKELALDFERRGVD